MRGADSGVPSLARPSVAAVSRGSDFFFPRTGVPPLRGSTTCLLSGVPVGTSSAANRPACLKRRSPTSVSSVGLINPGSYLLPESAQQAEASA